MFIKREWASPLTIGSFLLMATTGVAMFFEMATGISKLAHEWLGWGLVIGGVSHSVANWPALTRYFSSKWALGAIILFIVAAVTSFLPIWSSGPGEGGPGGGRPGMGATQALINAPIETLAIVAKTTPEAVVAKLAQSGVTVTDVKQPLSTYVGTDMRKAMGALDGVFGGAAGPAKAD